MVTINLLPWREEMRQEKKKAFLGSMAIALVGGLVLALAWGQYVQIGINTQNQRNAKLTEQIEILKRDVAEIKELKTRRKQVLERMEVIQSLQGNRPEIVKVYDETVRVLPDGVYLVSLNRSGANIKVAGLAESNNRISSFMRRLDSSYKFSDPNLIKVEADDALGEQGNRFDLRFKIQQPENLKPK